MKLKQKNIIIVVFISFIISITSCTDNKKVQPVKLVKINRVDLYNNFIKIYGILKYYHPLYSTGIKSIDSLFLEIIPKIDTVNSITSYNNLVTQFIGTTKSKKLNISISNKNIILLNDSILNKHNYNFLNSFIREIDRNSLYYVTNYKGNIGEAIFKNEKLINDTIFPNFNIRLLGIAKFWNALNYFYPYKTQIHKFDNFIKQFIKKVKNVKDAKEYHLLILEMTSYLKDAHVSTRSTVISDFFGDKYLPFSIIRYKNKYYANKIIVENLNIKSKYQILKINNIPLKIYGKKISKYISSSNREHYDFLLCNLMSKTKEEDNYITYVNNRNDTIRETVHSVSNTIFVKNKTRYRKCYYTNDTAYLNLINITKHEIDYAFANKNVIILDLRHHIRSGVKDYIADKLFSKKIKYFYLSMPNLDKPGTYNYTNNYTLGGNSTNIYNGEIIIFVNGNTISQAESAVLIYKQYIKSTIVGRTTCGANGNVSYLELPGKIRTRFSGIGVYNLNKDTIQFKGIVPQKIINKSFNDYFFDSDEMLKYYELN